MNNATTKMRFPVNLLTSSFILLFLFSGCAVKSPEKATIAESNTEMVEKPSGVSKPSKNANASRKKVFQCHHGTGGVIVSCSRLDCSQLNNVSDVQCKTLSHKLTVQSAEIARFADTPKLGKSNMKAVKQAYFNNTIMCLYTTDTVENKPRVTWAKFQAMTYYVDAP